MLRTIKLVASPFTLAAALVACAVVGCSATSEGPVSSASDLDSTDGGAAAPDASPDASGDASAGDGGTIVQGAGPMASRLVADLQAAGLDPASLPALESLDDDTLHKVMRTFTKSLGVQCNFCHDTSDFSLPTPQKNIAAGMWKNFVLGLQLNDGSGALYCDSCHQGRPDFLDRSDHHALATWMGNNFVGKLKRTDGAQHNCSTCHGQPFQGDIFKNLWHAE